MKELSIEEKAQRYDEAKLRMSAAYNSNRCTIGFMNEIFPELKESEDEKIRKELIKLLRNLFNNYSYFIKDPFYTECITWLEKQGEQKPVVKVEPKFHEGDWTVSNLDKKARQISEVHFDEYNSYYVVDGESVNLEEYDRLHRLWTIQDAKDGDMLYMDNGLSTCTFIYKSIDNVIIQKYASYNKFGFEGTTYLVLNDGYVCPATKKQRETLIKVMADAGYTFDFEKKELKKIEQKPTFEMKTPEESLGIDSDTYNKIVDECIYGDKDKNAAWSEEDKKQARQIQRIVHNDGCTQKLQEQIEDWFKSLKDRVQSQPKQEWSEEDKMMLQYVIEHFERQKRNCIEGGDRKKVMQEFIDWLKSLKDRVQPQPKQEWSEEDIVAIDCAVEVLSKDLPSLAASIERLKSLKSQNEC